MRRIGSRYLPILASATTAAAVLLLSLLPASPVSGAGLSYVVQNNAFPADNKIEPAGVGEVDVVKMYKLDDKKTAGGGSGWDYNCKKKKRKASAILCSLLAALAK